MYFINKTLIILVGSLLIALGINFFLVPFHLLDGGGIGLGLIIHYLLDIKVGIAILCISVPIFLLAWIYYRPFFYNGIHGLLISSVVIDFFYPLHIVGGKFVTSSMVGAICGGILIGCGVGIMLRSKITLGGTDLLAQMLAKRLHFNPGLCILSIDIVIVSFGSILVEAVSFVYSCVTVISVGITTSFIVKKHY
ncbi:YitT family protein [Psychrobacillus soli]|uniref:YitT family protein n=1 Tax=Psychrobacillus soli TaxID=1543965 RepID=A0A544SV42_9BACI|nr:YitT family protein [Psychrobacillus soli]TQR09076.1 YitT family protein [Psychrobacillus soli]